MSELAAADVLTAPTTLGSAISAVPHLRSSCSAMLDTDVPGSGLKVLRLVSKQLRTAMLSEVKGYTLKLDGRAVTQLIEMNLLQGTSMSSLSVVITPHMDGLHGWTSHAMQLRMFLCAMGPAIQSITVLDIDTQSMDGSKEGDMIELFGQLAFACPALQQIQVTGNVERGLLIVFGGACPDLDSLVLTGESSPETVQQLHLVLPTLSMVELKESLPPSLHLIAQPPARFFCLSLLSCTTLSSFDAGACVLTPEMWAALPSGMRWLYCALSQEPLVGLNVLSNLRHFGCYCPPPRNQASGIGVVALLRAAPGLTSLDLLDVNVRERGRRVVASVALRCLLRHLPDLIYLHNRVSAGLVVRPALTPLKQPRCEGLILTLWHRAARGQGHEAAQFIASLPPLPGFSGLVLDMLEGSDLAGYSSIPMATASIATRFPSLVELTICGHCEVSLRTFVDVGACTGLRYLCFDRGLVTPMQLATLCPHLMYLQVLDVCACEFTVDDGIALERLRKSWGVNTRVNVYQFTI